MLPGQSSDPRRRTVAVSRSERYAQAVPRMPIGTFTQNTACQSHSASTPPSSSPRNDPAMAATWLMPSAMPRWWAPNASVMIAVEFANSIAPPTPCTTRQPISHSAPALPCQGTSASATDAAVKTTNPWR